MNNYLKKKTFTRDPIYILYQPQPNARDSNTGWFDFYPVVGENAEEAHTDNIIDKDYAEIDLNVSRGIVQEDHELDPSIIVDDDLDHEVRHSNSFIHVFFKSTTCQYFMIWYNVSKWSWTYTSQTMLWKHSFKGDHQCYQPSGDWLTTTGGLTKNRGLWVTYLVFGQMCPLILTMSSPSVNSHWTRQARVA